ncbi:hypothetical protein D1007_52531 [Hordeum vulgare]|nr:hypothetical protein D1007_52531 [Hordeum vulgare]
MAVADVGELVVARRELEEALGGDGGEVAGELGVLSQQHRAAGHERVDERMPPRGSSRPLRPRSLPCLSALNLRPRSPPVGVGEVGGWAAGFYLAQAASTSTCAALPRTKSRRAGMEASRFGFQTAPAFKFDPTDADLVTHYLLPRAVDLRDPPFAHAITDDDPASLPPADLFANTSTASIWSAGWS